jgi:hypothetical protein
VRELSLPVSGPAVVVVFEHEGPVRLLLAGADGEDDALRVGEWISASGVRARHGDEIRERMGASAFGNVLETAGGDRGRNRPGASTGKVAQLRASAKGGN